MILTGCGSSSDELVRYASDPLGELNKDELIDMYYAAQTDMSTLSSMVDEAYAQIDEIQNQLDSAESFQTTPAGIVEFSDGSGKTTFNSVDSIIYLDSPFEYPNTVQAPNKSAMKVDDSIYIKPSANWQIVADGSYLKMYHSTSEIAGTIALGNFISTSQKDRVPVDSLSDYINSYFSNVSHSDITINRIYNKNEWCGVNAKFITNINEQNARIICGLFYYDKVTVSYIFTYSGEVNSGKDENITALLQTITLGNNLISIQ